MKKRGSYNKRNSLIEELMEKESRDQMDKGRGDRQREGRRDGGNTRLTMWARGR